MTQERIETLLGYLNEGQKRIFLGSEAIAYGRGGIWEVERISGVSRRTIRKGIKEIENKKIPSERIGVEGGGRKSADEIYSQIEAEIRNWLTVQHMETPSVYCSMTQKAYAKMKLN